MNRYLLFANQPYCFPILRPLQDAIIKRGDQAAWFIHKTANQLTANDAPLLESVEAVQEYNPTAVFVPTNWIPDFFPGVKVEVFHGFDVGKRANTRQEHARIRGLFDLYCTQGPHTTEQFESRARRYGHFKVTETGWPMLDPLFEAESTPTIREQLGITKPVILFGSTFSPEYSAADKLAPTIHKLSQSGRWHWLVNLHPKMDSSIVEKYQAMQGPHLTFFDCNQETMPLLKSADAMLCDTSSFFLQFLLLNKPVVTFNTAVPGPHLLNIHQTGEIESALAYALTRPPELMKEIQKYGDTIHPYRDGKSSARVLQATDEFVAHDLGHLKSKPFNLWRKIQMR
ncbi:MAG: hypothetical protein QG652_82 [Pseudomonadota bacterium]|nr:hypothetical protein [Pseudomonadota bacterium]